MSVLGRGLCGRPGEHVTHVLVPGDSYSTTSIHALSADGTITHEIDTLGWSTRMFKLR